MSIGSGNDKVSVPNSKTSGDKILTRENLKNDFALSLLRYVDKINQEIEGSSAKPIYIAFAEKVMDNWNLILLWGIFLFLIILLIQQKDGFQSTDLILPIVFMAILVIFLGINALSSSNDSDAFKTTQEYGIITETKTSENHYVTAVVISDGKTTSIMYVPHVDYINDCILLTYDLKPYSHRFVSTDSKSAWDRKIGDHLLLTIFVKSRNLISARSFRDFAGGKTNVYCVWGGRKLSWQNPTIKTMRFVGWSSILR